MHLIACPRLPMRCRKGCPTVRLAGDGRACNGECTGGEQVGPGRDDEVGGGGSGEAGCDSRISATTLWTVVRSSARGAVPGRMAGSRPGQDGEAAAGKRGAIR